jgi:hypothetical protein
MKKTMRGEASRATKVAPEKKKVAKKPTISPKVSVPLRAALKKPSPSVLPAPLASGKTTGKQKVSETGAGPVPNLVGWNDGGDNSHSHSHGMARLNEIKMQSNTYLSSLLNPWGIHGVKIPSGAALSVNLSVTRRISVLTDANGRAFLSWGYGPQATLGAAFAAGDLVFNASGLGPSLRAKCFYDASATSFVGDVKTVQGCCSTGATITPATPFLYSGAAASTFTTWDFPDETVTFIETNMSNIRVVSAGMAVNTTASALNTQGTMTLAAMPRGFFANGENINTSASLDLTQMDIYPSSNVIPLNKGKGGTALYMPLDDMCREFTTIDATSPDILAYEPTELPETFRPGFIVCYVDGAEPSTTIFFDLIVNLEGVPNTNSLLQAMATSCTNDTMALDHADDVIESIFPTFPGTNMSEHGNGGLEYSSRTLTFGDVRVHPLPFQHPKRGSGHKIPMKTRGNVTIPKLSKSIFDHVSGIAKNVGPAVRMLDTVLSTLL